MKFASFVSLVLPALVAGQDWAPAVPAQQSPSSNNVVSAAAASNSTSNSTIFTVTLGQNDAVAFTPTTLSSVNVGDIVAFVVSSQSQGAHGVVESTADAPCTQRSGGFDSGLVNPGGNFSVVVNSTSPIYIFCPQFAPFDHCTDGMVMIINPASPSAFSSFEAAATTVQNEATATVPASVGVAIAFTSNTVIPTGSSSSGSSSSGTSSSGSTASPSPTTSGAVQNLAGARMTMLISVFALALFTLA